MSNVDKLRAVAAENAKNSPHAVSAAIDRQLKSLTRVLAQAGVEIGYGKISASKLSKQIREAGIDTQRRLEVKIALERAGLLAD
jgi:hypothetical protein